MIKERVKSIILVILVIFTLVLAERILVDKKLWPTGYNFFSMGRNSGKTESSASDSLILPQRIIVNTGYQSSRFEFLRTSDDFEKIYAVASEILNIAFKSNSKNISQVSDDVWYSALSTKSVYLSYPGSFSAQNFAGLMGIDDTTATFGSFCDIVIGDTGSVYINDNGTYYKIETSRGDMSPLIEDILNEGSQSVINYSFDLNFDKEFGSQKTILSPMIPIYFDNVLADAISSESPLLKDGEIDQKIINTLLTTFSVNPNSTWRYTEADGTVVFVENTGVLKISPEGILTFTANDAGLAISSQIFANAYETASTVANFVGTINTACDLNTQLSLTSSLSENTTEQFTFDYNIGGIPVKYKGRRAVTVTVSNGYITEYSQVLRRYSPAGYRASSPLYFEALDLVIAEYQDSMNQINIKKMFPAYIDDLSFSQKHLDWHVEIDNVVAE